MIKRNHASLILVSMLLLACGRPGSESDAEWEGVWQSSVNVDSTGVTNIAQGDTIHSESGLMMY